jgi:hypothetical protein
MKFHQPTGIFRSAQAASSKSIENYIRSTIQTKAWSIIFSKFDSDAVRVGGRLKPGLRIVPELPEP